ncbi:MAG: TGS domain-containing protein, partial [bacterium]|nr:TGS domain-containing protein [bacterium]
MPANLPPQYYELEREYKAERDPREKLRLAQELLRMMPKHKGTDKLQAEMKAKISKLKKGMDSSSKSSGAHVVAAHDHIEREGAGQVILIGPPNSGKSSLVDALTGASPIVADYAYSTREPVTGMMDFETVQLQLIDTPPISPDLYDNYLSNLVRNADVVLLVCDLADVGMELNTKYLLKKLEEKRIILKTEGEKQPDDPRLRIKKTLICAHKEYEDESGEQRAKLAEMFPGFTMLTTSIIDDDSLDNLRRALFEALSVIRIYTKHVGHEVEMVDPVIVPIGGTVEEAAVGIHKDFGEKLKFAKIWGQGKYDGQRVNRDFV